MVVGCLFDKLTQSAGVLGLPALVYDKAKALLMGILWCIHSGFFFFSTTALCVPSDKYSYLDNLKKKLEKQMYCFALHCSFNYVNTLADSDVWFSYLSILWN